MTRMFQREYEPAALQLHRPLSRPVLAFSEVTVSVQLSDFFAAQTRSDSRVRSGMLFGYSEADVLFVLLATSAGVSNWYPKETRAALEIDPKFAIGWSEAVLSIFGGRLDWVGNWVVHPDSQLKSNKRDLRSFRSGFESGLIHDRSILLVSGYADGVLQMRAYTRVFEEGPALIPVHQTETTAQGQLWKPGT